MWVDAALADQLEVRELFKQRANLRALANERQRFGAGEPCRKLIGVLDVVVEDRDLMSGKLTEARQCPHSVVVIVEDGDFHRILR